MCTLVDGAFKLPYLDKQYMHLSIACSNYQKKHQTAQTESNRNFEGRSGLMEMVSSKHCNLLDLVRVYCACLVIFIHMGLGPSFSLVPCLARQAVPFFFLVSGFFFGNKVSQKGKILPMSFKYASSILPVYIVWALLWTPFFFKEAFINHADHSVLYVIAVVLRRICLAGAAQYWYLLVLAEGVVLLGLVIKFRGEKLGWVLCILGLILRFMYDLHPSGEIAAGICKIFYMVFSWENNVIMTGFPLLFLGYNFSQNEKWLSTLKRSYIGFIYLASVLLAFIIYGFSNSHYGIPFWLTESLLLFLFCILPSSFESMIPVSLCRTARNLSSVIYLTHTIIRRWLGITFNIWEPNARFFLCVVIACVLT